MEDISSVQGMSTILIYNDEGVSLDSFSSIKKAITCYCNALPNNNGLLKEIKEVDSTFLKEEVDWESRSELLVIPGGRDLPYLAMLGPIGMGRIRRFVKICGGKYLGICAGAYFGSDNIYFGHSFEVHHTTTTSITGDRLSLAPYKAIGPINPGEFEYSSENGAKKIEIKTPIGAIKSYYNGGPFFRAIDNRCCTSSDDSLEWEEISRYSIIDEISSIGGRDKGSGGALQVLLLGTHFEFEIGGSEEKKLFSLLLGDLIIGDPSLRSLGMIERLRNCFSAIEFRYFPTIPSTQKYLLNCFNDGDFGTNSDVLVLSDHQTEGHGRKGSGWLSRWGNLQFSLSLSISRTKNIQMIQYLACLAITECLCNGVIVGTRKDAKSVIKDVRIKWPNDIFCCGEKVGGIIVQSMIRGGERGAEAVIIVVGVGINLEHGNNDNPFASLNSKEPFITKESVLKGFLEEFLFLIRRHEEGLEFPFKLYEKRWIHSNQRVFLESEQIMATITGLNEEGFLKAVGDVCDGGRLYLLEPDLLGGLSKGVIQRK